MKVNLTALMATAIVAGWCSAATAQQAKPFDQIQQTAPRSPFDQIQDTAPKTTAPKPGVVNRAPFDQIQDTAPRAPFDQLQDTAPRAGAPIQPK